MALATVLRQPQKVRRLVLTVTAGGMDLARLGAEDWRPASREQYPRAASWIMDERPDLSTELPSITQPTLLLWGDVDPISPLAVGEAWLASLPQSALHVLRGGTHSLVQDRPDEIAELIRQHLA